MLCFSANAVIIAVALCATLAASEESIKDNKPGTSDDDDDGKDVHPSDDGKDVHPSDDGKDVHPSESQGQRIDSAREDDPDEGLSADDLDSRLPNILLMMADDLGHGDLGCFGNTTLRTPHLDRLAAEGVKLTHSLAAESICTPSRAAFLTGRYPIRTGMSSYHFLRQTRVGIFTSSKTGLPASELTFAEVAKQAGYSTALIGKWHLGWSTDRSDPDHMHPLNQGFDYYYGIPLTNIKDFDPRERKAWRLALPNLKRTMTWTCVMTMICTLLLVRMAKLGTKASCLAFTFMLLVILGWGAVYWQIENLALLNSFMCRNYELVEQPLVLESHTRKMAAESVQFLKERARDYQPFLLFVSWLHTHTALDTAPQFKGSSGVHGPYGDAVQELDWGVGQVMQTLEKQGLAQNTLVYFTSDNGGHLEETDFLKRRAGGYNGVFRGGKGQGSHEGGIRVPTILRWPEKVPAGQVIDEPVSLMDVFPTVARAMRVQLPANHVLDGRDLTPLLIGKEKESPHKFMMHYCSGRVHAVRHRPRKGSNVWKMVLYQPNYLPNTDVCSFMCTCNAATPLDPPLLFDLTSDPEEKRPLLEKDLAEYWVLVRLMRKALAKHEKTVIPVPDKLSAYNLLWRPWDQPYCNFPHFKCNDSKFDPFDKLDYR